MAFDKIKKGKILVEIKILNTEKLLNLFWTKNIRVYKVKKSDFATLILEIDYLNYAEVKEYVESLGGRINIIKSEGFVFFLGNIKKKLSLVTGGLMFLCIIYYLSTYIWAIEVDVQQNVSPFEIRKQLKSIDIKPGIPKNSIDVKEIEKKLENIANIQPTTMDVVKLIRILVLNSEGSFSLSLPYSAVYFTTPLFIAPCAAINTSWLKF